MESLTLIQGNKKRNLWSQRGLGV